MTQHLLFDVYIFSVKNIKNNGRERKRTKKGITEEIANGTAESYTPQKKTRTDEDENGRSVYISKAGIAERAQRLDLPIIYCNNHDEGTGKRTYRLLKKSNERVREE